MESVTIICQYVHVGEKVYIIWVKVLSGLFNNRGRVKLEWFFSSSAILCNPWFRRYVWNEQWLAGWLVGWWSTDPTSAATGFVRQLVGLADLISLSERPDTERDYQIQPRSHALFVLKRGKWCRINPARGTFFRKPAFQTVFVSGT